MGFRALGPYLTSGSLESMPRPLSTRENKRVSSPDADLDAAQEEEHFRPTGTLFLLAIFVVLLVLLWFSVYAILLSRGVTT